MIRIINYKDHYKINIINLIASISEKEFETIRKLADLEDIQQTYQKNNGDFWIALDNDKVIGTVALFDFGDNKGYVKRMYVAEKYRGTGVAQKLLAKLIEFAKKNKYKEIFLITTKDMVAANKFYYKEGFRGINNTPSNLPSFRGNNFYKMKLL